MKTRIAFLAASLACASCAATPAVRTITSIELPARQPSREVVLPSESREIVLALAGPLHPGIVLTHEDRTESAFDMEVAAESHEVQVRIESVKDSSLREEVVHVGDRLDRSVRYGEVVERTVTAGQEETAQLPVSFKHYVVSWENGARVVKRGGALASDAESKLVLEDTPYMKMPAAAARFGQSEAARKPFAIGESIDDYARAMLTGVETDVTPTEIHGKLSAIVVVDGEPCGVVRLSAKVRSAWKDNMAMQWDVAGEVTVRARDGVPLHSEFVGPAVLEGTVEVKGTRISLAGSGTMRITRKTATSAR